MKKDSILIYFQAMCGITGIYNAELSYTILKDMTDSLAHRGPDDEGHYLDETNRAALGHRRLSIIDLETGHQPMANEDETVWIVFNGEIYNYKSLRNELSAKGHIFKTRSDTESIIHCYEEYSEEFIQKISGIFSFAIWDSRKKRLIAVRDRAGVKPFYYYIDRSKKILIFASEIKAILRHPLIRAEPDYESIDKYLTFLYLPDENTLFKNIKKLMPGQMMIADDRGINIREYWDMKIPDNKTEFESTYNHNSFSNLFEEVVKEQMMSEVPIGGFLSGGIDSSSVCSMLARNSDTRLKTFSVGYSKDLRYDEYYFAEIIGKELNADMHKIDQDPYEFADYISKITWHSDEPSTGAAIVPLYFVSKLAKANNVKVVFTGDGGDELFVGYPRYFLGYLHHLMLTSPTKFANLYPFFMKKWGWRSSLSFIKRMFNDSRRFYFDLISFFDDSRKAKLLTDDFKSKYTKPHYHIIEKYFNNTSDRNFFEQLLYVDFKTYLPGVLELTDKLTMCHSLEARVPFLDDKVVDFAVHIPLENKIENNENKIFLKKSFSKFLPSEIINASKKGLLVPAEVWLRNELYDFLNDILLSKSLENRNIFNMNYVKHLIAQHKNGIQDHSTRLWVLLTIEIWFRVFIDKNKQNS